MSEPRALFIDPNRCIGCRACEEARSGRVLFGPPRRGLAAAAVEVA